MQDPDGSFRRRSYSAQGHASKIDRPYTPPKRLSLRTRPKQHPPSGHGRTRSLLSHCSSSDRYPSPPPTYSSQPPAPSSLGSGDNEDDTNRHDLIERLTAIVQQLQTTADAGDVLNELRVKVDEMEDVLEGFLGGYDDRDDESDDPRPSPYTPQRRPPTPAAISSILQADGKEAIGLLQSISSSQHHSDDDASDDDDAGELVYSHPPNFLSRSAPQTDATPHLNAEIERLNTELTKVHQDLRTRKDEIFHINATLLEELEAAAHQIIILEEENAELTSSLETTDSDLRNLRLELRAVETLWRSSPTGELTYSIYSSPAGTPQKGGSFTSSASTTTATATTGGTTVTAVDIELFQCIENWKADWKGLRDRAAARKKQGRKGGRFDVTGQGVGAREPGHGTGRREQGHGVVGGGGGGVRRGDETTGVYEDVDGQSTIRSPGSFRSSLLSSPCSSPLR